MYSKLQLAKKYLQYYLTASNGRGHGIHSPFVFDFIKNVLNDDRNFYAYSQIENFRQQLLNDKTMIEVEDFGAGSSISKTKNRSVSDIAKHAAKNKKFSQLLFRIANYYQPKTMIELGASLGISSAYLASACPNAKLFTIEGAPAIARMANKNFQSLGLENIQLTTGNFDDIHWSVEMEQAWNVIKQNERATLTIDLFFIGLVFFREDFKAKQHFRIRF